MAFWFGAVNSGCRVLALGIWDLGSYERFRAEGLGFE